MPRGRKAPPKKIVEEDIVSDEDEVNTEDLDDVDISDDEILDAELSDEGVEDDIENDIEYDVENDIEDDVEEESVVREKPVRKQRKTKSQEKPKRQTKMAERGQKSYRLLCDSIKPLGNTPPFDESMAKTLTKDGSREYTILNVNKNRFTGKNPTPAAKKVASRISRCYNSDEEISFRFCLKETTQGSNNEIREYICNMKELDKPKSIVKGDTTYTIRFDPQIKSYKPPTNDSSSETTKVDKKSTQRKASSSKSKAPSSKSKASSPKSKASTSTRGKTTNANIQTSSRKSSQTKATPSRGTVGGTRGRGRRVKA